MDDCRRNGEVRRILILVLILNWLVAGAKIILGYFTGVISIAADGFHSLFDGVSNIVGLVGMRYASQPRDADHPYGHEKYETIVAFAISSLLLLTAYELGEAILRRIENPVLPEVSTLAFGVMLSTLGINFLVARYEAGEGVKFRSAVLSADSMHTKSDVFVTISVLLGMAGMRLGYSFLDPLIASIVLLLILRAAYQIMKNSVLVLTDSAVVDVEKIVAISRGIRQIMAVHKIRSRGDANTAFLDMHACFPPGMSLKRAHSLAGKLKFRIMEALPEIKDVVIHIEPDDKKYHDKEKPGRGKTK